jgi:endo-1,4-beta-xylanase
VITHVSRRALLGGGAALALGRAAHAQNYCSDAAVPTAPAATTRSPPLGALSKRVQWGVAIEQPGLYDLELVAALRAEAPRFLAIASGLKFGNLHPQSMAYRNNAGESTWAECDDTVALAKSLGVPIRGDCLAWNDWLPTWLTDLVRRRSRGWQDQLRQAFEAHFDGVFAHFRQMNPNPLRWCGVINEPFNPWVMHGSEPSWRTGAWLDAFGTEPDGVPRYIHEAFMLGERYSRGNKPALFINEANCENDRFGPAVRPAYLTLIDSLQKAGRHVDGVGLECHLVPQWMNDPARPDWRPFVQFLRDLAQRGVEIFLTELDINDCGLRGVAERDAQVAMYMRSFLAAALEVPAVTMISNWNFSDKSSWLRETNSAGRLNIESWGKCAPAPECPRPALYDEAMNPKRARQGLAEALGGGRVGR